MNTYPQVKEAAAVKIEHAFYGESFNLFLCLEESVHDEIKFQNELSAWLHKQLVKDKWPEKIIICLDFPRTSTGKIQKHLLDHGKTMHA